MSSPEILFTAALGLESPWSVDRLEFDKDAGRIDFFIGFAKGSRFDCPVCGERSQPVHDTRERCWRHLNFFEFQAFINASVPRTRCGGCSKTAQVEVPWARPNSGFTLMFEALTLMLAREMPVNAAADLLHAGDDPLWRIVHHHVDQARALEDYGSVKAIGIDETASRRRHDYITIVHDLKDKRVVFACPGKDSSTVKAFSDDFVAHGGNPQAIEDACIDMSKAYIKGVGEHLPNAAVSFDPFHVVALDGKALDTVRRQEVKSEPSLRGTRYVWLKDSSDWTNEQIFEFHHLSRTRLRTARAWRLKEALRDIYRNELDQEQAEAALKRWCSWGRRCRLEPFKKLAATLQEHFDGIVAHFRSGLSNGFVESINSLVQARKARARGYRSKKTLITMVYLLAGRLSKLPANPLLA